MIRFNYNHQGEYYLSFAKVIVIKSHSEQCTTHTYTHQYGPNIIRTHTTEPTKTMYFN
jgi:hypothetical protein